MKKIIVKEISDIQDLPISIDDNFWSKIIESVNEAKYQRENEMVVTIETQ